MPKNGRKSRKTETKLGETFPYPSGWQRYCVLAQKAFLGVLYSIVSYELYVSSVSVSLDRRVVGVGVGDMMMEKRNPQVRQKTHLRVNGNGRRKPLMNRKLAKERTGKKKGPGAFRRSWLGQEGDSCGCVLTVVSTNPFSFFPLYKARTASLLRLKEVV